MLADMSYGDSVAFAYGQPDLRGSVCTIIRVRLTYQQTVKFQNLFSKYWEETFWDIQVI